MEIGEKKEEFYLPSIFAPNKWDLRFLDMAYHISTWSKDPSTQVGAVIVDDKNRFISTGYNGFPKGIKDTPERLNNRELKYKIVVHAELNAISFAERSLQGSTLYTYPFMPCSKCAGPIMQNGISRIVAPYSDNPRWIEDFKLSSELFAEKGVEVILLKDFVPIIQFKE